VVRLRGVSLSWFARFAVADPVSRAAVLTAILTSYRDEHDTPDGALNAVAVAVRALPADALAAAAMALAEAVTKYGDFASERREDVEERDFERLNLLCALAMNAVNAADAKYRAAREVERNQNGPGAPWITE